ncbi:MAG: CRISPR-associated endonuclease Cas2 [Candidatus Cloacimonetes bacterium]|nr:CRISPR-associated endonuclease Cas2 [Candidatus Cloacimonadota bacterium]
MFIVVTYDVNTETPAGQKRLRKVAKTCENYGQRVQNSVFECVVDFGKFLILKRELEKIIDKKIDSLRYYNLGNKWNNKVEHVGAKAGYNPEGVLII